MFRYADGPYNNVPSGRPVSSLSSGSTDSGASAVPSQTANGSRSVSGPPSPAFQLNNYLHMTNWMAVGSQQQHQHGRRKDKEPTRAMGGDFHFHQQLAAPPSQQAELLGFNDPGAFSASAGSRQQGGKKSPKPDSYKTVMCQAWLESKVCSFAENCRFAHGEAELRPSKIMPKQNSKYKTKLCDKYTTTGLCPYGSRCLFIHPDNGNNAYIRPDKLVEVSQRHALADMNAQKVPTAPPPMRPATPEMSLEHTLFGATPGRRVQLRPHPSWPLEPAAFFQEKNEDDPNQGATQLDIQGLFGCFDAATTPNRVSLASGLSGYVSGGSSPFSTVSGSSVNLNISDDERDFERDYFRITGLEHLAEELTRNLTTSELW